MRMLRCMQLMLEQYDDQGNRLPPLCTFYAYCLMSNHVHLLLRVNQEDIGSTRTGERYGLLCDVAEIHPSEPDEGRDGEQGGRL